MKLKRMMKVALEETGLPWSLEPGGKHLKIILGGRLAGILPLCGRSNTNRSELNTRAQIRRIARELAA